MAGMLPGVEAARIRRLHCTSGTSKSDATAVSRPSFCLYASTTRQTHSNHSPTAADPVDRRCVFDESRLDTAAREAKRRLDLKLRPILKSCHKGSEIKTTGEVSKKLRGWLRLINWKSSEQREWAVCRNVHGFGGRRRRASSLQSGMSQDCC